MFGQSICHAGHHLTTNSVCRLNLSCLTRVIQFHKSAQHDLSAIINQVTPERDLCTRFCLVFIYVTANVSFNNPGTK